MSLSRLLDIRVFGLFFIRMAGAGLGLLSSIILSRCLGISVVGNYYFSLSLIVMISSLSSLGLSNVVIKHCSANISSNNLISFLKITIRNVLCTSFIFSFFAFLLLAYHKANEISINAALVVAVLIVLSSIAIIAVSFLQAKMNINYSVALQYIFQPSLVILFVLFLYFSCVKLSLFNVLLVFLCATVITLFLYLYRCFKILKEKQKDECMHEIHVSKMERWDYFITNSLGMIMTQAYIIISGFFISSSDVAVIAVSDKLTIIINMLSVSIVAFISPKLSIYYKTNDMASIKKTVTSSVKIILLICTIFLIAFVFLGKDILAVFGERFLSGYLILIFFLLAQSINAVFSPYYALLNMSNGQSFLRRLHLIIFFPSLLLIVTLTSIYGVWGLVVSKIVINFIINIFPAFFSKNKFGFFI
ncbi:oligosaccharide flippase family protein [Edwardsiella tarda]|uniref:oligosaccharide flippase family protein n=1 Tax=Edwardsiella tarda TaxID=636 RepID=UPI00351C5DE2